MCYITHRGRTELTCPAPACVLNLSPLRLVFEIAETVLGIVGGVLEAAR
jgi:hypothetical protein